MENFQDIRAGDIAFLRVTDVDGEEVVATLDRLDRQ